MTPEQKAMVASAKRLLENSGDPDIRACAQFVLEHIHPKRRVQALRDEAIFVSYGVLLDNGYSKMLIYRHLAEVYSKSEDQIRRIIRNHAPREFQLVS
jgi:hypothetical protein